MRTPTPIAEKFWRRVDKRGPDDCWEWRGGLTDKGYGQIGHRASWEIHNGPIPDGLGVLHRCDNRKCVNPAHLWLGTNADNNADMMRKGRHRVMRKLSAEQALEIFVSTDRVHVLARRHGVSAPSIVEIRSGRAWRHVTGANALS